MRNVLAALFDGDLMGRRFAIRMPGSRTPAKPALADDSHMLFLFRSLRLICHVGLGLVLASVINLDFTRRIDADDWARRWL